MLRTNTDSRARRPWLVASWVICLGLLSSSAARGVQPTLQADSVTTKPDRAVSITDGAYDDLCRWFGIGCPKKQVRQSKPAPAPKPAAPQKQIGATVQAGDSRIDRAITWAKSQVGSHNDDGWCLRFAQSAYGGYAPAPTAWDYWVALGRPNAGSDPNKIPRGALIFFGTEAPGHVGIALGDGQMISPLNLGKLTGVQVTSIGYVSKYAGWAMPPSSWPGR